MKSLLLRLTVAAISFSLGLAAARVAGVLYPIAQMVDDIPSQPVSSTTAGDTQEGFRSVTRVEVVPARSKWPVVTNCGGSYKVLVRATPAYPETAREQKVSGKVVMQVIIGETG